MKAEIVIRIAGIEDLPAVVRLLADDRLGVTLEAYRLPLPSAYVAAFHTITADPNQERVVASDAVDVLGVLQLTVIPQLTYQGGRRGLIEGVRVAPNP